MNHCEMIKTASNCLNSNSDKLSYFLVIPPDPEVLNHKTRLHQKP